MTRVCLTVVSRAQNATAKLVADKEVKSGDAARVVSAETRNKSNATARLGREFSGEGHTESSFFSPSD